MKDLKTSQIVLHQGFLVKSPPTKCWLSRWRKRWFVLRHSGEVPGQYFLEYYVEKECKKLKGRIDLDQCEEVDDGLKYTNRKQKFQYMFSVKTSKRTYYLVAGTEADMSRWVDVVRRVYGPGVLPERPTDSDSSSAKNLQVNQHHVHHLQQFVNMMMIKKKKKKKKKMKKKKK